LGDILLWPKIKNKKKEEEEREREREREREHEQAIMETNGGRKVVIGDHDT